MSGREVALLNYVGQMRWRGADEGKEGENRQEARGVVECFPLCVRAAGKQTQIGASEDCRRPQGGSVPKQGMTRDKLREWSRDWQRRGECEGQCSESGAEEFLPVYHGNKLKQRWGHDLI